MTVTKTTIRVRKAKSKTYVVYGIQNTVTNKWYIGITYYPRRRQTNHFTQLRKGTHHSHKLQSSFNKHGEAAFAWHILEIKISEKYIADKEIQWIRLFDSHKNGYNMIEGKYTPTDNPQKKSVIWNGIEYDSELELSAAMGLSYSGVRYRLARGYVADTDEMPKNAGVKIMWNGKEYPSINSAAKDLGIATPVMRQRLKMGHTCDGDLYQSAPKERPCTWNDVEYPTIKAAAIALGIHDSTMHNRIKKGYTSDEDMLRTRNSKRSTNISGKPKAIRIGRKCSWNGVEYTNVTEAANALGVSVAAMRTRLLRGKTSDSDITHSHIVPCTWNGIEYASIDDAAQSLGISNSTMDYRVKMGYRGDADMKNQKRS
jgi:predicted GIY-YIG superfamily endonuclease